MEKENKRTNAITKLPLPKEPLRPLSQTLIKSKGKVQNERHPLKTINWPTVHHNVNGTAQESETVHPNINGAVQKSETVHPNINGAVQKSEKVHPNINGAVKKSENVHPKRKCPRKVDTRHVTRRQGTEHLDWNYHVLKDSTVKDSSIIIISDDEDDKKNYNQAGNYFVNNHEKNCLGEAKKAITPALKASSLEPNRIKNIKRSLKRPHTRELQGLSPEVIQERGDERPKRCLEFLEQSEHRPRSSDFVKLYMECFDRDYTKNLFCYLLKKEQKTALPRIGSETRACLINWLIRINGVSGNPAVIQSAIWYLDAVLTACRIQHDFLQVTGAACYWIAQKTHGHAYSARRLVRLSDDAFNAQLLLSIEKVVIQKLNFPSQPVIPQEFITYLSWRCEGRHHGEIELAATFFCMAGMMVDKSLCREYPSVLAVAAVRNAIIFLGKNESMLRLQMDSVYTNANRKATSISLISIIQRKAIRCMSSPYYKYNAPLKFYKAASNSTAEMVIRTANDVTHEGM